MNRPNRLGDRVRDWAMANPLSALTGVGFVFYVVLRVVYSHFYGSFGIRLEDVNLGYAQIIAQSVVGVGGLLAVMGLYSAAIGSGSIAWVRMFRRGAKHIVRQIRAGRWKRILRWSALALLSVAVALYIWLAPDPNVTPAEAALLSIFVTSLLAIVLALNAVLVAGTEDTPARPTWHAINPPPVLDPIHVGGLFRVSLFLATIALFCGSIWTIASWDVNRVKDGVEAHGLLGSWNADLVQGSWPTGEQYERLRRAEAKHCLLYFGHADGIGVFYDASGDGMAFRVPMGSLILWPSTDPAKCRDKSN